MIRFPDVALPNPSIECVNSTAWIVTDRAVYRTLSDVGLDVEYDAESSTDGWKQVIHWLAGPKALVSGVYNPTFRYRSTGRSLPIPQRLATTNFDYIASPTAAESRVRALNDRFSAEGTPINLSAGAGAFYFRVRDNFGNSFVLKEDMFVWPTAAALPLLLATIWIGIAAFLIFASPYSRFCRTTIVNPWFRRFGSAGIIPLLLSMFPPLRRHFPGWYVRQIERSADFVEAGRLFIPPSAEFLFESFSKKLEQMEKAIIVGRPGLGKTTFLRYLCARYAQRFWTYRFHRPLVPIFIPIMRYPSSEPIEMFFAQMAAYGEIYDKELAEWFLRSGGFVLFIDGLNEVPEATRQKVCAFIDSVSRNNVVCVSSQQRYTEFAWLRGIDLAPLGKEEIQQVLARHTEPAAAERACERMDRAMLDIYCVPQNIMLSAPLVAAGHELPRTRLELYSAIFEPIVSEWDRNGHLEYSEVLFERAFAMLAKKLPFWATGGFECPDTIVAILVENKLLVRAGENILFAHDLIRAFFAARHFLSHWREAASWETRPDRNWLPMLEFCVTEFTAPEDAEDLLHRLLRAAPKVAGEAFQLFRMAHPGLIEAQRCGFRRKSATHSDLKSAADSDLKPATCSDPSRPPIPI